MPDLNRTQMTEDFEFEQYVHALMSSSSRIRYLIFAIVITAVVVFVAYRHGNPEGWTSSRATLLKEALKADIWDENGHLKGAEELKACADEVQKSASTWPGLKPGRRDEEIRKISRAHGFGDANCWQLNYVVSKVQLDDKDAVRGWLGKIEQEQVSGIVVMRMPFLGSPFDINDLGIFSGLTYMVLMGTLWFAMVRHQENLYLAMWKVRELAREEDGRSPQGRANLLYHALSMSQLFTTPPTLARWETGATDRLPRLFFLIPAIMQGIIIWNDFRTYDRGSMVNEGAAALGWWIELTTFAVIAAAAAFCIVYARASDRLWLKTFLTLNPHYEHKIQPSWLEWVRLKPKAQAPGWGIACRDRAGERDVFVADFWHGKVWKIVEPGAEPPSLVVEKRCRELGVDQCGGLYGEHIPVDPPSKSWKYSVWRLSEQEGLTDELVPTSRPPFGQGVLRDRQGNKYSVDGRGPAKIQVLLKFHESDGRVVRLAGGQRGVLDGEGNEAGFEWVQDITLDKDDAIYLTDGGCIRRVTKEGIVSTIGGNPLGGKRRHRRCRLLGIAVTDKAIFAADYDFGIVWEIPREEQGEGEPGVRWKAGRFWSPAGLACAGDHLYILEHRPDSLLGVFLRWIGPWSRVRKVDLTDPSAEPEVLATFGWRPKSYGKPVKTPPPTAVPPADTATSAM